MSLVAVFADLHTYIPTESPCHLLLYFADPVFGCELATLCERQGTTVPKFFTQFTQHIEKVGLDVVGIYRLSGNAASINKLRYQVEQGTCLHNTCATRGRVGETRGMYVC